jgi:PGF-CTERM protein
MKGKEKKGVMLAVVAIALVVLASVASAQPEKVTVSDPIQINAEPASISADGESTSIITIAVFYPNIEDYPELSEIRGYEYLSGTPAVTAVLVRTTSGVLTDADDMNNTGKDIEVGTIGGVASVLLSGNETGVADITAKATGITGLIETVMNNETHYYVVENSTSVEFIIAPGTTAAPSGDGDGGNGDGIPPTPPAGTLPYLKLSANPADIPADGSSISTITALVWNGGYWVLENLTVNFNTSLGKITASAVIENGTATGILTAGTEDLGVATITAEANLNGDIGIITNTTAVNFTTPGVTPTPAVNVTLTPTPTVTVSPTSTATVSPTPTPSPTKKPLIPGFGAVFAIASLLAVAYLVLQRGREAQP